MSDSNDHGNAAGQLLEILAAMHPASMDFSNAIGKDKIEEDAKSGVTAYLVQEGLIERTGKEKYRYIISEKGKRLVENANAPKLDEEFENLMMLSIQPFEWEFKNEMLCQPLIGSGTTIGEKVPFVTVGLDKPEVFEPLAKTPNNEKHYEMFRAAAMRNLVNTMVEVQDVQMGKFVMTVVVGSYYAAEKVLDSKFMKEIQEKHGYKMLAVGLPRKGTMYITNGIMEPQNISGFMQVVGMKYAEKEQTKPISTTVFIVQDGAISGVIRPQKPGEGDKKSAPPVSEKKSFWNKLFGK